MILIRFSGPGSAGPRPVGRANDTAKPPPRKASAYLPDGLDFVSRRNVPRETWLAKAARTSAGDGRLIRRCSTWNSCDRSGIGDSRAPDQDPGDRPHGVRLRHGGQCQRRRRPLGRQLALSGGGLVTTRSEPHFRPKATAPAAAVAPQHRPRYPYPVARIARVCAYTERRAPSRSRSVTSALGRLAPSFANSWSWAASSRPHNV